jgi:hypothetical protein
VKQALIVACLILACLAFAIVANRRACRRRHQSGMGLRHGHPGVPMVEASFAGRDGAQHPGGRGSACIHFCNVYFHGVDGAAVEGCCPTWLHRAQGSSLRLLRCAGGIPLCAWRRCARPCRKHRNCTGNGQRYSHQRKHPSASAAAYMDWTGRTHGCNSSEQSVS